MENLFDTLIDTDTNKVLQQDFTPQGAKKWTSERYLEKQTKLAKVIAELGMEYASHGVAILGVAEAENKMVLDDLVDQEAIKSRNYQVIHYDSDDKRGIDVGLIYNPLYFKVEQSRCISLKRIDPTIYTRDQLLVSGYLNGEKIHVIVAHWPSRRGGVEKSNLKRELAASLGKTVIDSILQEEPGAKILYMGDLNDNPSNSSVKNILKGGSVKNQNTLFNPWGIMYENNKGTSVYKGQTNLFDQILISTAWTNNNYNSYQFYKAIIYDKPYLKNTTGKYKNYPYRTYAGNMYVGGYSDHLPVCLYLIRNKMKK